MVEFIIMIAIVVICGLLFGKADTKKELLNQVGLDLSERSYENKKEDEFRKYSIKAMKAVVELDYYKAQDEREFLDFMSDKLNLAAHGRYEDNYFGGSEYKSPYLAIKAWNEMQTHLYEYAKKPIQYEEKWKDTCARLGYEYDERLENF